MRCDGLSKVMQQFRVERDWTFRELSLLTGISGGALQRIEVGKASPTARTLYKLRKNIPAVDEFLKNKEKQEAQNQSGQIWGSQVPTVDIHK